MPLEVLAEVGVTPGVALEVLHVHVGDTLLAVVATGGARRLRCVKPHCRLCHVPPLMQLLERPPHVDVIPAGQAVQAGVRTSINMQPQGPTAGSRCPPVRVSRERLLAACGRRGGSIFV